MKLLVITREFPPYVAGGISYHLKNLYSEALKMGHDVTILAGRPSTVDKDDGVETSEDFDLQWVDYYSLSAHHLQFPIALLKQIRDMDLDEYDAALTHTEIPFNLHIPTIHKVHDAKHIERHYNRERFNAVEKLFDTILQPTRRWTTQKAIQNADSIIFNSNLTMQKWGSYYNIDCNTNIIYNGVDTNVFYPRSTSEGEFLFFVGDSPRKGLPEIRSFAKQSEYPVYVAGDIDDSEHVHSLGRLSQEELAEYYSSALATLHPAQFEAFGNVILESLACGTPVVVSENCGAAEIVDDSCGRITTDISQGIREVYDISSENCVHKATKYSWENVAKETLNVIKSIID